MLTNVESWYGLTGKEVETLEKVDEQLLRRILSAHSKTAIPALYLELGCVPLRFIIMQRRIGFLWYIMNEPEDSLIRNVFNAQLAHPAKGDWCGQVRADMEKLEIKASFDTLSRWSVHQLKSTLKSAVVSKAFAYLSDIQKEKSKIKEIKYSCLKLQSYLSAERSTTIKEKSQMFRARTRMMDLKANFKLGQTDLSCSRCSTGEEETQRHVLSCPAVTQGDTSVVTNAISYEDLLEEDPHRVETLGHKLNKNFSLFKNLPCDRSNAGSATGVTQ